MTYENQLKALADPSRRALYERLRRAPAHTVALTGELSLSQPAVSQHLKALREAGLVSQRSEGRRTLYFVIPDGLDELKGYLHDLDGACETAASSPAGPVESACLSELAPDAIALAARQWGEAWPGLDPNIYAVTMRLLLMGRYVERALRETAERHGLQGSELLLLDVLNLAPGQTLTPSELQARLGITKGAITKLMYSLEGLGLIARSSSTSDRRVSHVTLTNKAHDTLATILNHHEYGADHAAAKRLPSARLAGLASLLQLYHGLMEEEISTRAQLKNVGRRKKQS